MFRLLRYLPFALMAWRYVKRNRRSNRSPQRRRA